MSLSRTSVFVFALSGVVAACDLEPPKGTQIGALREPEPPPAPPSDIWDIDLEAAVADAFALAGISTLGQAWAIHGENLAAASPGCPQVWIGNLPEDVVDVDMDDDNEGLSWLDDCATTGGVGWNGWAHWTTQMSTGTAVDRTMVGDLAVTGSDGVWLALDGDASDSIDTSNGYAYASTLDGELVGTLVEGGGVRGELEASWASDGSFRMSGMITDLDGFGPPDTRDPATSPEVAFEGWTAGMPRFTSVRYDLTLEPSTCGMEPTGYLGIRGNEGFWLDVYFLPIYDIEENTAQSNAFPFELIDNQICDGIGTLFARNLLLEDGSGDGNDTTLVREVAPDFAAIVGSMPAPMPGDTLLTLRELTETP
jgi:hypothetical protein